MLDLKLQKAAELQPDHLGLAVAFGELALSMGDLQVARSHAIEALRQDAGSEEANLLMGNVEVLLGDHENAAYHASFVLSQNPTSMEALRLFCRIKMRRNRFFGLWWHWIVWNVRVGWRGQILFLLVYAALTLSRREVADTDYALIHQFASAIFFFLLVYCMLGAHILSKAMKKELKQFSFNGKF